MAEKVVFPSVSGAPYLLSVHRCGEPFKALAAVHGVLSRIERGYRVVYVGQTGDLSCRFDNHHKESCFAQARATHVAFHLKARETRRLGIEADLLRAYTRPVLAKGAAHGK